MPKLHYLTVQDILWINLQATKKVQHFNYARLEEATFYQYAYGESNELVGQAARFLAGFVRMRPLEVGVEATAFLAAATFLRMNGACLRVDDASGAAWFRAVAASNEAAQDAFARALVLDPHHHWEVKPNVKSEVVGVIADFPGTVQALLDPVAA